MDILTDSHHVTRLDVVDTGRRRRWSQEAKLRIVEESFSGFRQASATARRHGISRQQLFFWRKEFREGRLGEACAGGFAPALVVPDAGCEVGRAEGGMPFCAPSRAGRMEVVSANGRRVIVDGDVDVAALLRIVQALESLR